MKTDASRNTSNSRNQLPPRLSRRKFIQAGGAAATAFTIVPRHVLGGQGFVPPSEKITVAYIGCDSAWVAAFKGGKPTYGDFLLVGPISDALNLGAVSLRLGGRRLLFDAASMKVTNLPEANKHLVREYRKGWELTSA